MKQNLAAHYQILTIIWTSLLASQALFLVVAFFAKPELLRFDFSLSPLEPNAPVILGLAGVAFAPAAASFVVKRRLYEQAVHQQDPAQIQAGLITALALCEASSLIGLFLAFAFDYQYFFLWVALGIVAMLLHYPKQDDLLAAGYRQK